MWGALKSLPYFKHSRCVRLARRIELISEFVLNQNASLILSRLTLGNGRCSVARDWSQLMRDGTLKLPEDTLGAVQGQIRLSLELGNG
jgi:hypothetical protein